MLYSLWNTSIYTKCYTTTPAITWLWSVGNLYTLIDCQVPHHHEIIICNLLYQLLQKVTGEGSRKGFKILPPIKRNPSLGIGCKSFLLRQAIPLWQDAEMKLKSWCFELHSSTLPEEFHFVHRRVVYACEGVQKRSWRFELPTHWRSSLPNIEGRWTSSEGRSFSSSQWWE